MKLISDLEYLEKATVLDARGESKPVLEVRVVEGYLSDPQKLKFTWSVLEMTRRQLSLQLYFENAIFISS